MQKSYKQIKAEGATVREASFEALRVEAARNDLNESELLDFILDGLEMFWELGFSVGAGIATGAKPEDFERETGSNEMVEKLKKLLVH